MQTPPKSNSKLRSQNMRDAPSNHVVGVKRLSMASLMALGFAAGSALLPPGMGAPAPSAAHAQAIVPASGPASFSPVVKAVAPAVVHIEVTQRDPAASSRAPSLQEIPPGMREFMERFFGDRIPNGRRPAQPRTGLGSGFFVDAEGHIVTNNHVIAGAEKILVTMKNGSKLDAKLVGTDSRTDLALLKVERKKAFPYVGFGDSDRSEVGDWIVAVGNPFGLDHTVTTGIISARGRSIGAGPYDDFLQIDAPINKGNSGGPAFNLSGEVIGVNTAIFSPTGGSVGIGFAIPSNLAKTVIAQLKDGGTVERGWLGVSIQSVTDDIANGVGLEKSEGAIVAGVAADGPADKAGLKIGDVIMDVNGEHIEEMPELPRVIAGVRPDSTAKIKVWRDGRMRTMNVKIGRLPDEKILATTNNRGPERTSGALGLTLAPLDAASRRAAGLDAGTDGVLITDLQRDSSLVEKGVEPGAVLLAVAGVPVNSPSAAAAAIAKAEKSGRSAVLLLVRQNGNDRFVAATLKKG